MPSRIRLLDEAVANQIAAGEVIERPASVVKELIENSLDAGATRIDVEIEQGGRNLIRITDDGCGMGRDDTLLCLERHATSKVRTAGDLFTVRTFGFRGEAIPSIASVSEFRIRTAEAGAVGGTELLVRGGRVESVRDMGLPPGTQVEARRLFFNLPGRRKFLRSAPTEYGHIEHLVRVYAAAHPRIAWHLRADARPVLELPATESHERRVRDLFGEPFAEALIAVSGGGTCAIRGWVGRPGIHRASRSDELWFVNGRPVDNRTLYHAIREAYRASLPRGRHPVALLFVDVPPDTVDVNVHPAKREVRFRDSEPVRAAVVAAVGRALYGGNAHATPPAPLSQAPHPDATDAPAAQPHETSPPAQFPPPGPLVLTGPIAPRQIPVETSLPLNLAAHPPDETPDRPMPADARPTKLRILGVTLGTLIVAESNQGLVIIDQRAAHERILFEDLLRQRLGGTVASQQLLAPETLELGPREAALLRRLAPQLRAAGLDVHDFGRNTFKIEAVPPFIQPGRAPNLVRDVIADIDKSGAAGARRHLDDDEILRTICHRTVHVGETLKGPEIERLIEDLHRCDLPYTCPRGRPTMILIGARELRRRLGRTG